MTVLVGHFTAVFSMKLCLSLQDTKTIVQLCNVLVWNFQPPPLLGYSNSLRVTRPDVVVIGLLCVDGVPQGSGSLCLHVLLYKQVLWEQRKVWKKNKRNNNGWMEQGSRRTIPTVDVQAISRLFHELLTAKLFCVRHNKNNGDKWGKLGERRCLCERDRVSSTTCIINQIEHLHGHFIAC